MKEYFRAMEVDESGLRSSPSLGHFTIFEMAAITLSTPDSDSDDAGSEMEWRLKEYVVSFWLQHFLDVDMEGAGTDTVHTVVNSLFMIMNPEGEGLKNIESYSGGAVNRNIFGAAPYPLKEQFFKHFDIWLGRARTLLGHDSNAFSDEVIAWLATCTSAEETLLHVARGHVMNMYRKDRSWKVRQTFELARTTLRMV